MVRLAYLVPRIIILALIALAVWVSSDPLCRRVFISKIQNATGAKAEIGHLRYSPSNQKIFLKDLAFADARAPMRNLLQAEMAYLEFDPASLIHRQVIIERGETSHVVFGAPRTVSGALPGFPTPKLEEFKSSPTEFQSIEEFGLAWVDQFPVNNVNEWMTENFELVQAALEVTEFWKTQLSSQVNNIATLKQKRDNLTQATIDDGNPLRRKFVNAESEFEALALQTTAINARLIELERLALSDRDRLTEAFNRDSQKLSESFQAVDFDSKSVSKLLLTKLQEERISEIIGWFNWFRSVVPDPSTDFQPKQKRGKDILFPGLEPRPSFLIKSIDIEGDGRFANQQFNFAGSAFDLTTEPTIHDKPATFSLRAQGDQHLIVSCTLDRRGELPTDSLNVACPDMELPEQLLGEKNSMLITMGPASRIQADIQINATGDRLTGELIFRHSNVSLHVDQLHELVGGTDAALQLNQGLVSVDRFETRATLSGTLEDYEFQFDSDLGSRFASAANQLLNKNRERQIGLRKSKLQDVATTELSKLTDEILPEIRRLAKLLEEERIEIASRRASHRQKQSRFPKMR